MQVIETTAHVGSDGMLRIEVVMDGQRDRDAHVTVVVESAPGRPPSPPEPIAPATADSWAPYRSKLEASGLVVPRASSWSARTAEPLHFDGPPVSQSLVEDRR